MRLHSSPQTPRLKEQYNSSYVFVAVLFGACLTYVYCIWQPVYFILEYGCVGIFRVFVHERAFVDFKWNINDHE